MIDVEEERSILVDMIEEVMKTTMKRLIREEQGKVLILVLILLVVGGLVLAPVLGLMSTGLVAGQVYEKKTAELYAADAGVEDAIWKIQQGIGLCVGTSTNYTISDVNGKSVGVTITYTYEDEEGQAYLVESIATGDGSGTKIEAYVIGTSVYGDFSGITNNVITSLGEITLQPGAEVYPDEGEHAPQDYYTGAWPTVEDICAWYFEDVEDEEPYDSDTIDLYGVSDEKGPLYRDGELEITNSINPPATLTLTGTLYITGDTLINPTKEMTLDLNEHTIFVASNSSDPQKALEIGGKVTIVGPGAIIAIGDIYFAPDGDVGGNGEPVFVFSVSGETLLQPGGDFYGSVAGSIEVTLQPGTSLNFPETGFGVINFPGCTAGRFIYTIATWEVGPP